MHTRIFTGFIALLALAALGPALSQQAPVSAANAIRVGSSAELLSGKSDTAQPDRLPLQGSRARVTGFQSAIFGMTENEVRAAVTRDFGSKVASGLHPKTVESQFSGLATESSELPLIGSGTLIYVFGPDHRLYAVNLERVTVGPASQKQREDLVASAQKAAADLEGQQWKVFSEVRGKPIGANDLLVFAGADEVGNGIEVDLIGADYTAQLPDGTLRRSPKASGPAALRILYEQDIDHLAALKPGDF